MGGQWSVTRGRAGPLKTNSTRRSPCCRCRHGGRAPSLSHRAPMVLSLKPAVPCIYMSLGARATPLNARRLAHDDGGAPRDGALPVLRQAHPKKQRTTADASTAQLLLPGEESRCRTRSRALPPELRATVPGNSCRLLPKSPEKRVAARDGTKCPTTTPARRRHASPRVRRRRSDNLG